MKMQKPIETDRLIIRSFIPEDVSDLHEILGDNETMRNCEPAYHLERTEKFLQEFCIDRNGAVAAVQKQINKMIGYILFNEYEQGVYEIGWIFNRGYWRQGYAYEACHALIQFAFSQLPVQKIYAESIDAVKSVKLMKKLGMTLEETKSYMVKDFNGNWADMYLYSLTREQWEKTDPN